MTFIPILHPGEIEAFGKPASEIAHFKTDLVGSGMVQLHSDFSLVRRFIAMLEGIRDKFVQDQRDRHGACDRDCE